MLDKALNAFRKRVIVAGIIKSDSGGIPRNIRVESIEILPDEEMLPQSGDIIAKLKDLDIGIQPYEQKP